VPLGHNIDTTCSADASSEPQDDVLQVCHLLHWLSTGQGARNVRDPAETRERIHTLWSSKPHSPYRRVAAMGVSRQSNDAILTAPRPQPATEASQRFCAPCRLIP